MYTAAMKKSTRSVATKNNSKHGKEERERERVEKKTQFTVSIILLHESYN
jgi:hypothetical protein